MLFSFLFFWRNRVELNAIVGVFGANEILDDLPLRVPAVPVELEVLACAHLLGLVKIEVPFNLVVLLRDFIHESLERHPVLLVFAPDKLNLTFSVGCRHWPAS